MYQTTLGKIAWSFIVCLCFFSAGYLIHSSYSAWQESPVSTSITTHPIADLDFPTVTVCPPKGSNTALNYDLMKADNNSLTEENREAIKKAVNDIFLKPSHKKFISQMVATGNTENLRTIYKGFQKFPKPNEKGGLETMMSNNYGEISTPWFGKTFQEDYHKKDRKFQFELEINKNLIRQVGSGSLVIELEVDTRKAEGWQEEVVYSTGSRNLVYRGETTLEYKLYTIKKNWVDAEAYCQSEGGHLASVLNEEEQEQVSILANGHNYVWLGGSDKQMEGVWRWTDGSVWNYTNWWNGFGNQGDSTNCVAAVGHSWGDYSFTPTIPFICVSPLSKNLISTTSITLNYTKEQLTFSSFIISYAYHYNQDLLDSWEDKRMTGFRLSWRIEPAPLALTTAELGRSVQTPGLEGDSFDNAIYMKDRTFKTTLLFPDDLKERIGSGSLAIRLEVDTRVEQGWQEEVVYTRASWGFTNHKLFAESKTWAEAEAYCQGQGGHLASILTAKEQQEARITSGGKYVWIGGSDQEHEGVWQWTDGSAWGFTSWKVQHGRRGNSKNCAVMLRGDKWTDESCANSYPFICQSSSQKVKGNTTISLNYNQNQLTFFQFHVKYHYSFSSQELVEAWKGKRMTGFRLSWFLQDINGSRLAESKPHLPEDWKPANDDAPMYGDVYLARMVQMAYQARQGTIQREQILKKAIQEKAKLILRGAIDYTTMCLYGQVKSEFYETLFDKIQLGITLKTTKITRVTEEDVKTGFRIFSTMIYCSEPVALTQFLHSLISIQSPRTIIRAIVNTIQSGDIQEDDNRKRMNEFYIILENIFQLQLGKILLATSSSSQLLGMIAKGLPYFTQYSKDNEQCNIGANCTLLQSLGKPDIQP